ncbi:hypothetical protein Ahy_A06g026604 [Arachis hypogaea]|uniref:SMP-LTD domain-containing protein n=1 Tax=Arachis hypogaea TaxID=3818 RepID=A0A445CL11_ARAHY|nr:hypothetical protein Ahy_A06g026604 [Arachis hypogaea]
MCNIGNSLDLVPIAAFHGRGKCTEQLPPMLSCQYHAKTVAMFARMTVEDSKFKWLNTQLDKMWPFINDAASELIKSSVEPILEQYKPVILAFLTFSKLTLSTVAPQFTAHFMLQQLDYCVKPGRSMIDLFQSPQFRFKGLLHKVGVLLPKGFTDFINRGSQEIIEEDKRVSCVEELLVNQLLKLNTMRLKVK